MTKTNIPSKEILKNPKDRRAWVNYQLRKQGQSLAEIGRKNGVENRTTMYIAFRNPYPRIEKIIAESIGLTPQQLFPERYDKDGLPNRPMGRPKKSHIKTINKTEKTCNVKKRAAA